MLLEQFHCRTRVGDEAVFLAGAEPKQFDLLLQIGLSKMSLCRSSQSAPARVPWPPRIILELHPVDGTFRAHVSAAPLITITEEAIGRRPFATRKSVLTLFARLKSNRTGDFVEFLPAEVFESFSFESQLFVDLDGLLSHHLVRFLGAAQQRKVGPGGDAFVPVGVQSDAEHDRFLFVLWRRFSHRALTYVTFGCTAKQNSKPPGASDFSHRKGAETQRKTLEDSLNRGKRRCGRAALPRRRRIPTWTLNLSKRRMKKLWKCKVQNEK